MLLTEKVLAYQAGHWTWTDLWKDLFLAIDGFLEGRCSNAELTGQVINQLTPRLHTMVAKFNYQGKPFEAFLFTAVHYQLKTAYAHRRKERVRESSLQAFHTDFEASPEFEVDIVRETPKSQKIAHYQDMEQGNAEFLELSGENRRLAIVALKNCAALDDALCLALSEKLACNLTWFMNCRDELRDLSGKRLDMYRQLKERERAAAFALQCQAHEESDNQKHREKLGAIRRSLQRMNPYPRHQDIARVLGIPKGTVDSSLFYVRRMLANACKNQTEAS